jgi:hypothetical protein
VIDFVETNVAAIVLVVAGLCLLGIVMMQTFAVSRLNQRINQITGGVEGGDLEEVLSHHLEKVHQVGRDLEELAARTAIVESSARRHFSKQGLVRFNPFPDTGGNQSFALVLLDESDDGVIVSSLHSRTGTRIYAKAINAGKADTSLSTEEQEAIDGARSRRVARPATPARSAAAGRGAVVEVPAASAVPALAAAPAPAAPARFASAAPKPAPTAPKPLAVDDAQAPAAVVPAAVVPAAVVPAAVVPAAVVPAAVVPAAAQSPKAAPAPAQPAPAAEPAPAATTETSSRPGADKVKAREQVKVVPEAPVDDERVERKPGGPVTGSGQR